jgi:uncharacterized protein YcfL
MTFSYKFLPALALLACSVLFFPARASENGPAPSISSRVEQLGRMTHLTVTDLRAVKRDGLLRVQAEITNGSTDNQQLYYRFRWLDQDGFAVWDEEPWKPQIIYGLQKQVLQVVAPTFKASDFRLELQSPKNEGKSE